MNVILEIKRKTRGNYKVHAYRRTSQANIFIGEYEGLIPQIKDKIEEVYQEKVEIERSIFQGWY